MTHPINVPTFEILAASVPNVLMSSVPIAACKAGMQGLLDLEYADVTAPETAAAVQRLRAAAPGLWGIKLAATSVQDALKAGLLGPDHAPETIVVTALTPSDGAAALCDLRAVLPSTRLLAEVFSSAQVAALSAYTDGFVAKGHEAGGRSGDDTSLILLQHIVGATDLPVLAHGGAGPETVAAFRVAGAAGALLDWQLALFEAAQTPVDLSRAISRMDGSETHHIACGDGTGMRVFWRADHKPGQAIKTLGDADPGAVVTAVTEQIDVVAGTGPWLVGQDAAFGAALKDRYGRLGPALKDLQSRATALLAQAAAEAPLSPKAPLALSMGTEFPIVQGPMTRVSDRAAFAAAVAEGGALPMLALALMRGQEAKDLVAETKALLADRPWGIGILGFVDDELRREQTKIILDHQPKFALIAGGRPEQALELEKAGIATFLHVPSPGLLKVFLEQGARRFIFEGRECGGHVGPRTSAVLWQQAITELQAYYGDRPMDCQVLFAGGIHDGTSAAMVSAMSAGLAAQGAEVGVIVGSAYIFTQEAVIDGAVVPTYQDLVVGASETVLLESGVGHATRVVQSPIAEEFQAEKTRLLAEGLDPEEVRDRLERFNVGRSRVASKGIDRNPDFGKVEGVEKYVSVPDDEQRLHGVYMIGQVAGLRHAATTIADLHGDISDGSARVLAAAAPATPPQEVFAAGPGARIALTGIATILPKAPDKGRYWENILDKVDAISEVPERRWDWRRFYDADKEAPDKAYSKWGGFVDEMEFDPIRFGIPPKSMTSIEPLQLLALEVVGKALEDAGFADGKIADPALRKRTSVIIGVGGGSAPLGQQYAIRSAMPAVTGEMTDDAKARLPEWTEDSFPGILLNVIAGRVANRFDLGGVNFTVDAACGSSLAAVLAGMRELETGNSDMVIVAGVDAFMSPFDFIAFSKTQALSPRGKCRTFDATADGIAISEGLAAMVLRPLEAAEGDGDRIYAVVRGVAGASDGRDLSLTAPRPEGQQETLRRAYTRAGISPASVGLIEAHGTGTVVGDRTEVQSLSAVFGTAKKDRQFCGLGSVKSMIGHTKAAAGCAGMAKVAMALHHRVLPPTLNVEEPSPSADFPNSPFFPVTETRPWLKSADHPRRAGVSAFGFGGTNFHAVLEEYEGGYLPSHQEPFRADWPHEVLLFSAEDPAALAAAMNAAASGIPDCGHRLADIAAGLAARFRPDQGARFALVASSPDDAAARLRAAAGQIADRAEAIPVEVDPMGAFFASGAALDAADVAFLFPGQGSQYPDMASGLTMYFPAMRQALEASAARLAGILDAPLGSLIYPRPAADEDEARDQARALTQTNVAQPAIGAVSAGILGLLGGFGAKAGAVAGHSFGELTALAAAGAFDTGDLIDLAFARGDAIIREGGDDLGTMLAVTANEAQIRAVLGDLAGVTFANFNAPDQTVLAGADQVLDSAAATLEAAGLQARKLPVACAFHSEFVAPARDRLAAAIADTAMQAPQLPVYANETGAPYPKEAQDVAAQLTRHLTMPVNFLGAIESMHDSGARLFVEVGPNAVLSRLTQRILADKPHLAVATDVKGRAGPQQLLTALAAMSAAGLQLDLSSLWDRRTDAVVDVVTWAPKASVTNPHAWMIDPARVRPVGGRPARIGLAGRIEDDVKPAPAAMPAAPVAQPETAGEPAPVAPAVPAAAADIMRQHHTLMAQMMENHARTMQMFLGGASAAPIAPSVAVPQMPMASAPPHPPAVVPEPLAPAPQAAPEPAPAAPASAPLPTGPTPEAVTAKLLDLISERTGYPPEMLGRDLNLEADLGIDSIKRVEILAGLRLAFLAEAGEAAHDLMGPVSRERTVDGIVAKFMEVADAVTAGAPAAAAAPASAPLPTGPTPEAVTSKLLDLISERTGYPPEMLGR
ncbi:MAG: beta-ketoacyl synthase N-terminal-like domain-containing protein, partial [Marinibacterium sp.]